MNAIGWIKWVAKALTAAGVAFLAAIVSYNMDVEPWILVLVTVVLAFLGVFLMPNSDKPE